MEDSKDFTQHRNAISKHKENIRRWTRMISDAQKAIEFHENKMLVLQGREYYVYLVYVDSQIKYIGKGKKERYKHAISGASSCPELNRDFFSDKKIEVLFIGEAFLEEEASSMEQELIYSVASNGYVLYNKDKPKTINPHQIFWDLDSDELYDMATFACSNKE